MAEQFPALPRFDSFQAQHRVYDLLKAAAQHQQFSHAYLLTGPAGVGKRTLARVIAQGALCTGHGNRPCSFCDACQKVAHGNHADVHIIGANPKETIKVDHIREQVLDVVAANTVEGNQRVFIIENAHRMNAGSQNALLKTLEEPIPGNIFLLVTSVSRLLLPTIRSRCQELRLHPWDDATLTEMLRHQGLNERTIANLLFVCEGSIGKAIALSQDESYWQLRNELMEQFFGLRARSSIFQTSAKWSGKQTIRAGEDADKENDEASAAAQGKDQLLDILEEMMRRLMQVNLHQTDMEAIQDYPPLWQCIAREAGVETFIHMRDAIRDAKKMRESNVTWQAVIEQLLLQLLEVTTLWQT